MINIKHSTIKKTKQTKFDIIHAALEQPELASKILPRITTNANPFELLRGCYLMYQDNELVYVGVSRDIAGRLAQHRLEKTKQWDAIKYIPEDSYIDALKIEAFFIHNYKPKYNVSNGNLFWSFLTSDNYDENKIHRTGWIKKKSKLKFL
jgi:hypothetical protein